jgi:hypothetical protein
VETIRESKIPTLIGNYDQGVGNSSDDCGCAYTSKEAEALGKRSIAWSSRYTSEENKRFLWRLPHHLPLQLGGLSVLLVHSSHRRIRALC